MVEVNEFFSGRVKSLNVNSSEGKKTIGVISPGEFEFNTKLKETMTVLSGTLSVFLPEYNEWEEFGTGASFDVPADSKFQVKAEEDTAYLCEYEYK